MTTPNPYVAPAALGRRVAAFAIDTAIVVAGLAVLLLAGSLLAESLGTFIAGLVVGVIAWVLGIAWWIVYSAMQGGHGSIGMRLMKLQLVRLDSGAPLGFGRALLRNLIWSAAAAIVVGFFSVLFDRSGRHQGWHDKVAQAFMRDASSAPAASGAPAASPFASPAPVSPAAPAYGGIAAVPPAPYAAPAFPPPAPVPPRAEPTYAGHVPPRPPAPRAAIPAAPASDGLIAYVPGITQDPAAPADAAIPAAPAPSSSASLAAHVPDDVDGDTVLVRPEPARPEPDVEDTRLVVRTPPVLLEWDDGARHTVSARSIFGRNPAPDEDAVLVVVRDETLSLSKTHFEIRVAHEGAVVIDHHSTNGVTIVRAGERIDARPGEPTPLRAGDALEMGDRIATFLGAEGELGGRGERDVIGERGVG